MNKEQFIKELENATSLDHDKCVIINDVLENHFIVGKQNKAKIVSELSERLAVSSEEAEKLYETASSIIGDGLKDKLRHPFGSQD